MDLHNLISVKVAAKELNCSEPLVRKLIANGSIPAYKLGGSIRIDRTQLTAAFKPMT